MIKNENEGGDSVCDLFDYSMIFNYFKDADEDCRDKEPQDIFSIFINSNCEEKSSFENDKKYFDY